MARFQKGHIPTKEMNEKNRLAHLGKHFSPATEFKKGIVPWIKGKTHSEETRKLLSQKHLNVPLSDSHKINISKNMIGIKRSDEFKKEHSEIAKLLHKNGILGQKKEDHWNWKGGISSINRLLRTSSKWKIWRELVFLRDNFTCQNKNCQYCHNKIGVFLHPHHIKLLAFNPELAFDVNNGITYCKEFHLKSKTLHRFQNQLNIQNGGK